MARTFAPVICSLLCAVSFPAFAQDAAAQQADAAPAATNQKAAGLEDIVVTATRRAERLQDIPVAVTAVTDKAIAASGIVEVRQLTQVVPAFFGGRASGLFLPALRGVGSQSVSIADEPNVATYIDGIYQPDPFSTWIDLAEVERIEVLRGPQGTVFGRNATGGLINVITPDPAFDTHGHISARYGRLRNDANDYDVRGYVTGGLADNVAADFSGVMRKTDGYVKDLVRGGELGDIRVVDLRTKLLVQPTETSEVILTLGYANQKSSTNTNQPYQNNTAGRRFPGAIVPTGPWESAADLRPILNFERFNGALRTKFEFGAVNLETSTGYMHNVTKQFTDSDSSSIPLGSIQAPHLESEAFTQEVRLLSGEPGRFQWLLGGYFFDLNGNADIRVVSSPTGVASASATTRFQPRLFTRSYSGFGEGTYELVDQLFLTLGARYTWEQRKLNQNVNGVNLFGTSSKSFDKVTYRGAVRYQFTPEANVYVSYGTGYKSGVFNYVGTSPNPVRPETIKALEAGVKADPAQWLRANLAVFHYDYSNLQLQSKDSVGPGYILQNAASAEIYGGELELTIVPTKDLTLRGAASYTHARYKDFPAAQTFVPNPAGGNTVVPADASGNNMTRAPETTFTFGFDWGTDVGSGRLGLSGNVYHSARVFFDFANRVSQSPYTLASGEISYTTEDERWKFSLWGTNLTNEQVFREGRPGALGTDVTYEMPRRIGIGARLNF